MPRTQPLSQCPHCDHAPFSRPYHLRAHLDSAHYGAKRFKCSYCDVEFTRLNDRKAPERDQHLNKQKYACRIANPDGTFQGCDRVFARERSLSRHLRSEDGRACRLQTPALSGQRHLVRKLDESIVQGSAPLNSSALVESMEASLPHMMAFRHHLWLMDSSKKTGRHHHTWASQPQMPLPDDSPFRTTTFLSPGKALLSARLLNHNSTLHIPSLAMTIIGVAVGVQILRSTRFWSSVPNTLGFRILTADVYQALLSLGRQVWQNLATTDRELQLFHPGFTTFDLAFICTTTMQLFALEFNDSHGFESHVRALLVLKHSVALAHPARGCRLRWSAGNLHNVKEMLGARVDTYLRPVETQTMLHLPAQLFNGVRFESSQRIGNHEVQFLMSMQEMRKRPDFARSFWLSST